MNSHELQALRKMFFLDVSEAAKEIAGHKTPRTWQKYERGDANIPADVVDHMHLLVKRRLDMIEAVEELIHETRADVTQIDYYRKYSEYAIDHKDASVVDWRLSQSVAAYFFAEYLSELRVKYDEQH